MPGHGKYFFDPDETNMHYGNFRLPGLKDGYQKESVCRMRGDNQGKNAQFQMPIEIKHSGIKGKPNCVKACDSPNLEKFLRRECQTGDDPAKVLNKRVVSTRRCCNVLKIASASVQVLAARSRRMREKTHQPTDKTPATEDSTAEARYLKDQREITRVKPFLAGVADKI